MGKKVIKLIIQHHLFLLIFGVACGLRLLNPTFAQPVLYVTGDEPPNYQGTLYILANKSLIVRTAVYPPFGSYLQVPFLLWTFLWMFILGGVKTVGDLKLLVITQPGYFLFVSRIISGVLGSFTIYILYRVILFISPKSKMLALVASLFLTFSFNHGQVSHFGRPWAPAMFFFSLTMWFTFKSLFSSRQEKRFILLAALCAVVTYGIHQIGVFALVFFSIVRIIEKTSVSTFQKALQNKSTWAGFILIGIGIGGIRLLEVGNPTAQWFPHLKQFPPQYPLLKQIWELFLDSNLLYNIKQLIILEPGIFFFFIVSLVLSRPWKKPFTSLFIYTVCAALAIGTSFKQPRYLLPVLIPMSLFSAYGFLDVYTRVKTKSLKFGFTIISLLIISFNLIAWNFLFLRKSTATEAMEWIEKNVPPHETILSAAGKWVSYTPSHEVIPLHQKNNPHFFEYAYKILPEKTYPLNVRSFIYLSELTNLGDTKTTSTFIDTFPLPFHYLLDMYFDPREALLKDIDTSTYRKVASFSPLKRGYQQIAINNILATVNHPILPILLLKSERIGPYVDIYENTRYQKPLEE